MTIAPTFLDAKSFDITKAPAKTKSPAAIAFIVGEDSALKGAANEADKKCKGLIKKAVTHGNFSGKAGEILALTPPDTLGAAQIFLVGAGDAKKIDHLTYEKIGGSLMAAANSAGMKSVTLVIDTPLGKLDKGLAEAHAAMGAALRSYRFDKYRTTQKAEEKPTLEAFAVAGAKAAATKSYAPLSAIVEGVTLTRNVVTEPGNIIYPETLMKECKALSKDGVKVTALNETQMKKLGMGSLLGVAQGSVNKPYLVVMEWMGGKKSEKPVAFVGKGVTFDTGGISIKPANNMDEMKFDMGGSGTVIGLMKTLALRKAKANVIGVVGLVENMPDGNAQRPGDVVTSMSGQTIEVLNTDAEGRLVLADALWYTQDKYKPQFMIDLATLTGAILVALGDTRTGVFSNSDELCEKLDAVSGKTGEKVWRLPLGDEYDKMIDSPIADMQNIGADRIAGSITAGQFLKRFVNDVPWAHLDIAGTAWARKDSATCPKGATAWGVRLLDQLVADYYEK